MNELNKKYMLQMEVLTPLHVGAGTEKDWVQGSDFVLHDGKIKILNLKKVSDFVNPDDLSTALINKNSTLLINKLGLNLEKCVEKVFDCKYIGSYDIKTFIKNGLSDRPIVPGSSLKGAIRSVLLEVIHMKEEISNAIDPNRKKLTEQVLFGSANNGDEFFRFVKISDAEFENTTIVNTKIFNLKSTELGGWKHAPRETTNKFKSEGFNTFYEVIKPGEKSVLSIALAEKSLRNFGENAFTEIKRNIINNEIGYLFNLINKHTKDYLQKEKAFFEIYRTDKTDNILKSIDALLKEIPQNGEYCILKMAAGSGFHSITGDWQFEDYSINELFYTVEKQGKTINISRGLLNGEKSAKSRKIAIMKDDEFFLMGFVKLRQISKEEIQEIENERVKRQQEIENQLKAQEKLIAEQRRIEFEKQEELQRKQSLYNELILQATDLFNKGDYDAAFSCVENAETILLDKASHVELKRKIESALVIRNQENEALKAQQAIEQSRIESNRVPLSEKIERLDKLPTIFGNVKTWMKVNQIEKLENSDVEVLANKIVDVYSKMRPNDQKSWSDFKKWSDLSKVIGDKETKNIFDKLK